MQRYGLKWLLMGWLATAGVLGAGAACALDATQIRYQTNDAFLQQAFGTQRPQWKMLHLNAALKKQVAEILGHPYPGMRIRYWYQQERSAWIIDEVGKDLPITIGVVVDAAGIRQLSILVYREERGGVVHEDFFTRQFHRLQLTADDRLSRKIDGVTGATLSVHAVERTARLALVLHRLVMAP